MYGRSFRIINSTTPKVAEKEATGQIIGHSKMGYVHLELILYIYDHYFLSINDIGHKTSIPTSNKQY